MARSRTRTALLVVGALVLVLFSWPAGSYAAQLAQVFITNDDAHSVPVHMVGTPFQVSAENVASLGPVMVTFHVPAGQRAVVEYVAVTESIARYGTAEVWIETRFNGAQTLSTFATRIQTQDRKYYGQDDWGGNAPVTIYADPGTDITFTLYATGTASAQNWMNVAIAGYYVP
jgi:hypothetical protein